MRRARDAGTSIVEVLLALLLIAAASLGAGSIARTYFVAQNTALNRAMTSDYEQNIANAIWRQFLSFANPAAAGNYCTNARFAALFPLNSAVFPVGATGRMKLSRAIVTGPGAGDQAAAAARCARGINGTVPDMNAQFYAYMCFQLEQVDGAAETPQSFFHDLGTGSGQNRAFVEATIVLREPHNLTWRHSCNGFADWRNTQIFGSLVYSIYNSRRTSSSTWSHSRLDRIIYAERNW